MGRRHAYVTTAAFPWHNTRVEFFKKVVFRHLVPLVKKCERRKSPGKVDFHLVVSEKPVSVVPTAIGPVELFQHFLVS